MLVLILALASIEPVLPPACVLAVRGKVMSVPGDRDFSGSVNTKQIRRVAKSGRAQGCGTAKVKCSLTVARPQHLWTLGNGPRRSVCAALHKPHPECRRAVALYGHRQSYRATVHF